MRKQGLRPFRRSCNDRHVGLKTRWVLNISKYQRRQKSEIQAEAGIERGRTEEGFHTAALDFVALRGLFLSQKD